MYKMEIEKYIEEICPKIANILNEIIPEAWQKLYLYAEIHDFSGTVIFYYYNNKSIKPIYSLDIPKLYNIDEKYITKYIHEIYFYFDHLRNLFAKYKKPKWTSATFILDSTGKMKLDFSYEKLSEDDSIEDLLKWRKKYIKGLD